MSVRKIHGAAAVLAVLTGGCNLLLGLEHRELYTPDGGGGAGGSTTVATSTGQGGATVVCVPGATETCYDGPAGTVDKGICKAGLRTCNGQGTEYGPCVGEVTPQPEACSNPADEDCDGHDCGIWTELISSTGQQYVRGVAVDGKGNSFVAGLFVDSIPLPSGSLTGGGVFLIKLDPAGIPLWGKSFGTNATTDCFAVAADSDGNVVLGGAATKATTFDAVTVGPGAYVIKLSGAGDILWNKPLTINYDGKFADQIRAVAVSASGDVLVGGTYQSSVDFGDGAIAAPPKKAAFLAKLRGSDGSGKKADTGWNMTLCDTGNCDVAGIAVDGMGEVFASGSFSTQVTFGSPASYVVALGAKDVFLAKIASDGTSYWQTALGGTGTATATATGLSVDSKGGAAVAGTFNGTINLGGGSISAATPTQFVARYGTDKSYTWSKTMTASVAGIASDPEGNVFFAGNFLGSLDLGEVPLMTTGTNLSIFVAKISSKGVLAWNKGYTGKTNPNFQVSGLGLTQDAAPIFAGTGSGTIDFGSGEVTATGFHDLLVVKLAP